MDLLKTDIKEYHKEDEVFIAQDEDSKRLTVGTEDTSLDLRDILEWVKTHQPDLLL